MPSEADTCREHVAPLLQSAGWDNDPHSIAEQRTITDGRIVPLGNGFVRNGSMSSNQSWEDEVLKHMAPVSYTHLDVYKRQDQRCECGLLGSGWQGIQTTFRVRRAVC